MAKYNKIDITGHNNDLAYVANILGMSYDSEKNVMYYPNTSSDFGFAKLGNYIKMYVNGSIVDRPFWDFNNNTLYYYKTENACMWGVDSNQAPVFNFTMAKGHMGEQEGAVYTGGYDYAWSDLASAAIQAANTNFLTLADTVVLMPLIVNGSDGIIYVDDIFKTVVFEGVSTPEEFCINGGKEIYASISTSSTSHARFVIRIE